MCTKNKPAHLPRSKLENQFRCLLVNSLMLGLGPVAGAVVPLPTPGEAVEVAEIGFEESLLSLAAPMAF